MSQATFAPGPYRNSNLFSGYYLDERVFGLDAWDCDDDAREAFEEIRALYDAERGALASYDEAPLRQNWIDAVLSVLGYERLAETPIIDARGSIDRTLYGTDDDRRAAAVMKADEEYAGMYGQCLSILEAKQWDADFTERFSEERSYRDASHQIKYYLEHTPDSVSWGVLTNGRKWRLYGTNDYETETYYEVDLPVLLESGSVEVFKYFYVFFRAAAFRESGGSTFLDTVWSESETAARELGEDLQDNVFTGLRVLGEGFVETNDLAIDPTDDDRLAALKEQSLVLLYRLMFVLYAESRGLIDPDDPRAAREYDENFSLDALRHEVIDEVGETPTEGAFEREFSQYSTAMWGRLEDLFSLVDSGNASLGIPPYNGGLFDTERHAFLADNEIADRYLAEVVFRLSTTETDEGFVPADYADLDTRHLGTIYEGLLEHEFAVAPEAQAAVAGDGGQVWKPADVVSVAAAVETVEEGELYVVNDDGERKATGAYYTPDYVVTYIVEETVGPLLDGIEDELAEMTVEPGTEEYVVAFWERVSDLKILDPAMGSGHFLTKATGYLAEAVMERVRELETASLFDEEGIRREISRECIYGVDINGMAVELAKLSMWLETLAADQPLAFLDHHLKAGNSLVGSDISAVLGNGEDDGGQLTLAEAFAGTRKRALDHVMDLTGELLAIDNETLDDVHSMEEIYAEIRADPLYGRLRAMATVHTASQFGVSIPTDADERMARAIEDDEEWAGIAETDWFRAAQATGDEEGFFHWELEFPEVFFDMDGERMARAGFDAVVGNPPYIRIQELRENTPQQATYFTESYDSSRGSFDIYVNFMEKGHQLLNQSGLLGYIEPHKFFQSDFGEGIRKYLSDRSALYQILSFRHEQVFQGASVYTCVFILRKQENQTFSYAEISPAELSVGEIPEFRSVAADYGSDSWTFRTEQTMEILDKIENAGPSLGEVTNRIYQGLVTSGDSIYLLERIEEPENGLVDVRCQDDGKEWTLETDLLKPLLKGEDVHRYEPLSPQYWVFFPYILNDCESGKEARFVEEDELSERYPRTYDYLTNHEEQIRGRENGKMDRDGWYDYVYPKNLVIFENKKIVTPEISYGSNFTYDSSGFYHKTKVYGVVAGSDELSEKYLLSIINTDVLWFFLQNTGYALRGGYFTFKTDYLEPFSVPNPSKNDLSSNELSEITDQYEEYRASDNNEISDQLNLTRVIDAPERFLSYLAEEMMNLNQSYSNLNLDLLDYLGTYDDGPSLGEMSYQPASGLHESVLTETGGESEFETLRVTGVRVERDGGVVRVLAVPYVKPVDESEYETNSRGYATLEPVPAMEFFDVSEAQADLIEAFVPYAVAEAGGFAGYRDGATKTISPLDRLEGLTLPTLADVEGGVGRYMDARERAAELDEKIERTDELIDEIVYELYGLTDEEIAIVEDAVGG